MPKRQLKDLSIEESKAKRYGMAYAILTELEKFLDRNKEYFKSEIIGAFYNIPDDKRNAYERSATLAGIKFSVTIPMIVDKEKLKGFLQTKLSKNDYRRAVTVTPVYSINKEKLMENRPILRQLIDDGVLIRQEDNFEIHDAVIEELIKNGILAQAEIDANCKTNGTPALRLSGKGMSELKQKATNWVGEKFG